GLRILSLWCAGSTEHVHTVLTSGIPFGLIRGQDHARQVCLSNTVSRENRSHQFGNGNGMIRERDTDRRKERVKANGKIVPRFEPKDPSVKFLCQLQPFET